MIIYPAIDLRGGKVVRLKEGRLDRETIFSDDPLATAQQWIEQGAQWLHIVNLDGAFESANDNSAILEQIAKLNIKIQFGGGIRSLEAIERAIQQGAHRVVVGTLAIQNPDIIPTIIQRFGVEALCVALDAKDGKVATHGWQQTADVTPIEFGRKIASLGAKHALYTDVQRDGSLMGVNIKDTIALARNTDLSVIASGGVSTQDELYQLAQSGVIGGAIIGMALYENKLTLKEALIASERGQQNAG